MANYNAWGCGNYNATCHRPACPWPPVACGMRAPDLATTDLCRSSPTHATFLKEPHCRFHLRCQWHAAAIRAQPLQTLTLLSYLIHVLMCAHSRAAQHTSRGRTALSGSAIIAQPFTLPGTASLRTNAKSNVELTFDKRCTRTWTCSGLSAATAPSWPPRRAGAATRRP